MSRETMSTEYEALRLADALDDEFTQGRISNHNGRKAAVELRRLHEALETKQEPVISTDHGPWIPSTHPREEGETYCKRCLLRDKFFGSRQCDPHIVYTAPQKREWVGLTDEERHSIREWRGIQKELGPVWAPMLLYLYEAIEAKLKEKNT